jgi:hypothetical protein
MGNGSGILLCPGKNTVNAHRHTSLHRFLQWAGQGIFRLIFQPQPFQQLGDRLLPGPGTQQISIVNHCHLILRLGNCRHRQAQQHNSCQKAAQYASHKVSPLFSNIGASVLSLFFAAIIAFLPPVFLSLCEGLSFLCGIDFFA